MLLLNPALLPIPLGSAKNLNDSPMKHKPITDFSVRMLLITYSCIAHLPIKEYPEENFGPGLRNCFSYLTLQLTNFINNFPFFVQVWSQIGGPFTSSVGDVIAYIFCTMCVQNNLTTDSIWLDANSPLYQACVEHQNTSFVY